MAALILSMGCSPAPPANQRLGTDDGIFNDLTEEDCRGCHDGASRSGATANADRHHLLRGQPLKQGKCSVSLDACLADDDCIAMICEISGTTCSSDIDCPEAGLGETCGEVCRGETCAPVPDADHDGARDISYGCLNCHRQEVSGDEVLFIIERNCLACHIQVSGEASVHHLTGMAQGLNSPLGDPGKGDCTPCHGTIVDDIGDGHVIPVYKPSLATPAPSGGNVKPFNREGNGAGACDYCHSTGTGNPYVPGIDEETGAEVYSNQTTHHSTGVYLSETGAIISATCLWCHYVTPVPSGACSISDSFCRTDADCPPVGDNRQTCEPADVRIRRCEGCHGFDALHGIAADSDTGCFYDPDDPACEVIIGGEAPGFSHVGNDRDCAGCHGFSPSSAHANGARPPTPSISGSDTLVMTAGTDTRVTLTGAVFTTMIGGRQWASNVCMTGSNGSSVTLMPAGITAGSLTVTIPGSTPPGTYRLTAVKTDGGILYAESNPVVISITPRIIISEVTDNGNNTIIITGSGFGETPPAGAEDRFNVTANGQAMAVLSWTDTRIHAVLPAEAVFEQNAAVTVSSHFGQAMAPFRYSRDQRS